MLDLSSASISSLFKADFLFIQNENKDLRHIKRSQQNVPNIEERQTIELQLDDGWYESSFKRKTLILLFPFVFRVFSIEPKKLSILFKFFIIQSLYIKFQNDDVTKNVYKIIFANLNFI